MTFLLGSLDHITVVTADGKLALNQIGQISMKSPQLILVNMASFPEVRWLCQRGFFFMVSFGMEEAGSGQEEVFPTAWDDTREKE